MKKSNPSYEDKIAESLGSANSYAIKTDKFDPSLLNAIPRKDARDDWDIKGNEFKGVDVWHCHEATFLTNSGIPVAGTLKFVYNSASKDMVESKSMKLYLNTFDMCKMGDTIDEAISAYEEQVQLDLSDLLGVEITTTFHESGADEYPANPYNDYTDMHQHIKTVEENIEITDYEAKESHIKLIPDKTCNYTYKLSTNVLRSRCRHTKQKDTGSAYIHIETEGAYLSLQSLFKEIVALREVNEFHEFCAEKLYVEIMKSPYVKKCMVTLLYSRRGSLDINPVRASHSNMIPIQMKETSYYTKKTQGQ